VSTHLLEFSESLYRGDLGKSDLTIEGDQKYIFAQMSKFITKYLNIDVDYFTKIIQFAAGKWQNEGETLFQYFAHASPQERLHVAVKFSDDFQVFLEPHLVNPEEKGSLKKILEKSLEFYITEFANRER